MFANTMKSYKSHTVTDRVIDQNYYNYEQYERNWPILLSVKKCLHEVVWKMNVYIIKTLSLKDL